MFRKKKYPDRSEKAEGSLEPLILPNCRVKFSSEQLQNLNFMLRKKLEKKSNRTDPCFLRARSVAERLTQRLLCEAGKADRRFSSKFLLDNNPESTKDRTKCRLSFLVRLDELSTPPLYELDAVTKLEIIENDSDCPSSYCRIRLPPSKIKIWNEFINPNGYLRRDKVQTRLVKLLAEAAESVQLLPPQKVDESILCGVPGKIVDAATLHHIFNVPSFEQIYYGQDAAMVGFPDPSNFRIAIVDEPQGILLRLEFLSPIFENICLDVRLLVAIGIDAWPNSSNFPGRILLTEPDCWLYHKAAETGAYLVGFGVQSSAWQIRVPAAELTIVNHYGETSTIRTILNILKMSEEEIDLPRSMKKYQLSYKILNKYIFLTSLFDELENSSSKPLNDAINWCSLYIPRIVLTILDRLMYNLTQQKLPNYFFRDSNLLVNPGHLSEEDYLMEANNVKMFILKLYDESLQNIANDDEFIALKKEEESEVALLVKWKNLIDEMLPKLYLKNGGFRLRKSRNSKHFDQPIYSRYQIEYISLVLGSILKVRKKVLKCDATSPHHFHVNEDNERLDDVLYLTVILMDQARDNYLKKYVNLKNKQLKLKSQYRWNLSKFIETVKEDNNLKSANLNDDFVMVDTIINLLHKAADFSEKYLGRVLQPYLKDLFELSFAVSWNLNSIKDKSVEDELKSLGCFCKLLNSGEISPVEGILDAEKKNWAWAKDMLKIVEKMDIRIVLTPDREQVNQYMIYSNDKCKDISEDNGNKCNLVKRNETFLYKKYMESKKKSLGRSDSYDNTLSQYEILKMKSPLTLIIHNIHRRGEHRGFADTFRSLMYMKKMGLFQELTSNLPEEEKITLAEIINDVQETKNCDISDKVWTNTIPKIQKDVNLTSNEDFQKYISMEENAGVTDLSKTRTDQYRLDTLLRNCRVLRQKEKNDFFPNNNTFRLKEILKNSALPNNFEISSIDC